MNYYQIKYIRNGVVQPKEYTFGFQVELKVGDNVDLPFGHGVVVGEVSEEELGSSVKEKIKNVLGKTDEKKE